MKSKLSRRLVAAILIAAAGSLGASSTIAQDVSAPRQESQPLQGATANSRSVSETAYHALRAGEVRTDFLRNTDRQQENWEAADRFASCATNLNADRVRELLDQAIEGKTKKRVELGDFVNRNHGCVVAAGSVDGDFLRGALAQHIVVRGDEVLPPPGDPGQVTSFLKAVSVPKMDMEDPFVAGQLVAECRVGFAPVAARALLATEAGTPAETAALAAMKAVTPQCNSLDTAKTKLSSRFERAFAAQALYHWIGFDPKR